MTAAQRKPRARTYDPARTRAALEGQLRALRETVGGLCAAPDARARLAAPTRLGTWTVRELIVHIAATLEQLPLRLAEPRPAPAEPRVGLPNYPGLLRDYAEVVATTVTSAAAALGGEPRAVAARFAEASDAAVEAADGTDPATVIATRVGPMTVLDFLVTRLLETVVHGDDLAAATGLTVSHDRQALAAVTRLLADALAAKAPGGSVEVRIPPFAVVQCVAGPRHTRGTPPNVVETDPLTWIRLATGRTDWASAVDDALVSAGGERADISPQLPLLG